MKIWRFFGRRASGNIARDRLKVLLVSDRANCSPAVIENIREDLLNVLAKYVEVDTGKIDIEIIQAPDSPDTAPALVARVPLRDAKPMHLQENYDKAI